MADGASVYVSITGLRLKSPFHAPLFWWHAVRSMMQAQRAPGNLRAEARMINGVQHTLTVWTDKAAMRRYMLSGAHARAMRVFPIVATGSTFGFEAEAAPDWSDVHALEAHGVSYVPGRKS